MQRAGDQPLTSQSRMPERPIAHVNAPIVQVPEQTWRQLFQRGVVGCRRFIRCSSADRSLRQSIKNGEMCRKMRLFLLVWCVVSFLIFMCRPSQLITFAVAFLSSFCSLSESTLPSPTLIKKKLTISIKTGTFSGFLFV